MIKNFAKPLALPFAIALGMLFPDLHRFVFVLPYTLMLMLLWAFADLNWQHLHLKKQHLYLLAANLALPWLCYALLKPYCPPDWVVNAFLVAFTPTAVASPVVIRLAGGDVGFMVVAVLLTNLAVALLLPLSVNEFFAVNQSSWAVGGLVAKSLGMLALPLGLNYGIKRYARHLNSIILCYKNVPFGLFCANIAIATANAAYFIAHKVALSASDMAAIGGIALILCVLQFALGRLLGGKTLAMEAAQALGQKNNMFTIWLATAQLTPIAALGTMFYIVYHNLYNAYLLYQKMQKTK